MQHAPEVSARRKAVIAEHMAATMRGYAREAALAAIAACLVGMIGLAVCVAGQFDLRMVSGAEPQLTRLSNGMYALTRDEFDLTSLFLGIAAAGFSCALVVAGGATGHLRRMPASSAYTVVLAGGLSALGLMLLVMQR